MDLLKPCPFCEEQAEIYELNNNDIKEYGVRCSQCGASLPQTYEYRDFTILKWNQRGWEANI